MPLCPRTAAWPSGNIAPVLLHNIYGGHGSIPAHALPFYYYNNNHSCDISSAQHHSALFSVTQFCSVLFSFQGLSADQCWPMLSGAIAELLSSQYGWGRRNSDSDQNWSQKSSRWSVLIRTCGGETRPPAVRSWSHQGLVFALCWQILAMAGWLEGFCQHICTLVQAVFICLATSWNYWTVCLTIATNSLQSSHNSTIFQTKQVQDMATSLAPIGNGIYISKPHVNASGFDRVSQPT